MLAFNTALMRAEQPALQQRSHAVHARKQAVCVLRLSSNQNLVTVTSLLQRIVRRQAIGNDKSTRFNSVLHKWQQAASRRILDDFQADSANRPLTFGFSSYCDKSLARTEMAPAAAFPDATDNRLVHLYFVRQSITTRSHHRAAKLVQPCPGGFVRSQSE